VVSWIQEHEAWLWASAVLGVLLVLVGLIGMIAHDVQSWWRARRRVGQQAPTEQYVADRPYSVGIARGGDR
jgi:uncharacterized iron-regulated membrane protein